MYQSQDNIFRETEKCSIIFSLLMLNKKKEEKTLAKSITGFYILGMSYKNGSQQRVRDYSSLKLGHHLLLTVFLLVFILRFTFLSSVG